MRRSWTIILSDTISTLPTTELRGHPRILAGHVPEHQPEDHLGGHGDVAPSFAAGCADGGNADIADGIWCGGSCTRGVRQWSRAVSMNPGCVTGMFPAVHGLLMVFQCLFRVQIQVPMGWTHTQLVISGISPHPWQLNFESPLCRKTPTSSSKKSMTVGISRFHELQVCWQKSNLQSPQKWWAQLIIFLR